jgi:hypothetical protein
LREGGGGGGGEGKGGGGEGEGGAMTPPARVCVREVVVAVVKVKVANYFIHNKTHLSQLWVDAPPPAVPYPLFSRTSMVWGGGWYW